MVSGSSLFSVRRRIERPIARRREPPIAPARGGRASSPTAISRSSGATARTSTTRPRSRRLRAAMRTRLRELVDHCVAQTTINRTPSDFALADLDQAALDQLTGAISDADRRLPADADAAALLLDGRRRGVARVRAVGVPARRRRSTPSGCATTWQQVRRQASDSADGLRPGRRGETTSDRARPRRRAVARRGLARVRTGANRTSACTTFSPPITGSRSIWACRR